MFGLLKFRSRKNDSALSDRRSSDVMDAEVAVLNALHLSARRSSPHMAATRAGIARAIGVIEAATLGLCHIVELIDEAKELCASGIATEDASMLNMLAERYGAVIKELNAIAAATGHGGVQLIDDSLQSIEVHLCHREDLKVKLPHINLTAGAKGLALPKPARAFQSAQDLEQLRAHLDLVTERLDKAAGTFRQHGADLSKRLALILEGTIPDGDELKGIPFSATVPARPAT